jgi:hypothetical protein
MPPSPRSQTKPHKSQQAELLGVAAGFMLVTWETRHIPDHRILHGDRHDKLRSSRLEQSVAERWAAGTLSRPLPASTSFILHTRHWERKCENPMKILKFVKHTWWGADPVILVRFCKSLISWRMEYGAFLFHKLKGALTCKAIKITNSTKLYLINQVFMISSQKCAYLFSNV